MSATLADLIALNERLERATTLAEVRQICDELAAIEAEAARLVNAALNRQDAMCGAQS